MKRAAVLGSGSWGTALAIVLAEARMDVALWGRDPERCSAIRATRTNQDYLPGIELPANVNPTDDLADLGDADLILSVVPSSATRAIAERLAKSGVKEDAVLVSCSKGIERESGKRMTEILAECFPRNPTAALSGPNHAEEVARRLPSASVIGSSDDGVAVAVQNAIRLPWFRTYTSDDVAGIEIGGAVKNVFAISAGICDGLGLGDNAKAALVTRGLAEMVRIGRAFGGRPETFQGLSGVGDLVVTCYSRHSRNNQVGRRLGEGEKLADIIASMNMIAEGVPNTDSIYRVARRLEVDTPLTDQAWAILHQDKNPADALGELLARDRRPEADRT